VTPVVLLASAGLEGLANPLRHLLIFKRLLDNIACAVFHYVDGLVNLTAWLTRQLGLGLRYLQTGREETYLLLVFLGVVVIVVVRLIW